MTRLILAITLALPLQAATIINPPPGNEGNTLSIVSAVCPTCTRVSDEQDIDFSGASGYFIFAFEDLYIAPDRDFNDLIVWAEFNQGTLSDWDIIASYSAAQQSFGYDGRYVYTDATGHPGVAKSWSAPWLNRDGLDHVVTWTLPADVRDVPEPGTLALMLVGVAWWVWRKK